MSRAVKAGKQAMSAASKKSGKARARGNDVEAAALLLAMTGPNDATDDCSGAGAALSPVPVALIKAEIVRAGNAAAAAMVAATAASPPSSLPPNLPAARASKCNNFLPSLYKMCNNSMDDEHRKCITWTEEGTSFWVSNIEQFARDILPIYYKHNNYASFVRQLNMYGFHRSTEPKGKVEPGVQMVEHFTHQYFRRGEEHLLRYIHRKTSKLGGKADKQPPTGGRTKVEPGASGTVGTTELAVVGAVVEDQTQLKADVTELMATIKQLQAGHNDLKSQNDNMQAENGRQIRELAQTVGQLHKSNQRIEALVIKQGKKSKKSSSSSRPGNSGAKSGKRQKMMHHHNTLLSLSGSGGNSGSGGTSSENTNSYGLPSSNSSGSGTSPSNGFSTSSSTGSGESSNESSDSAEAREENNNSNRFQRPQHGASQQQTSSDKHRRNKFFAKVMDSVRAGVRGGDNRAATVLEYLTEQFPTNNVSSSEAGTILTTATRCGRADVVRVLVSRGIKDRKDPGAAAPLFWAAQLGHVSVLEALMCGGADVKTRGTGGKLSQSTPVHTACQRGHLRAAQCLVSFGSELSCTDALGRTARDVALSSEHHEIVGWIDSVKGFSAMQVAIDARQHTAITHMLGAGHFDPALERDVQPSYLSLATAAGKYSQALPTCARTIELVRLSQGPWSPASHFLYNPLIRSAVICVLLINQKLVAHGQGKVARGESKIALPALPASAILKILSFTKRADWSLMLEA